MKRLRQFFALALQALRGGEHDYTSGSMNKAIFMLSVPMIAEMLMESLFAIVDIYFVSKVDVDAVATIGLTESVLFVVYSIAVGMSMAVTAIVARRVGEKNYKLAADAAFQAIVLGLSIGLPLGVAGFFFAGDILGMMGGSSELVESGSGYARIMYAGNISIILLYLINAIFRGAGDASIAMRSLWLANGINIILDPLLIFGWGPFPEMGVTGAAIATTTGRSVGVCYQLYYLFFKGSSVIKIGIANMVVRVKTMIAMVKVAAGGVAQFLIESASWIFLVKIISLFGSEALAGYTIAFRVVAFSILPAWGIANAASTLVGQNLGAKQPDRAEQSVWRTAFYNAIFLTSVSVAFFLCADSILSLFTDDAVVAAIGRAALEIICVGYIFFSFGLVMGQAFNGAGDTRTPMWVCILAFWIVQIPLSYWMAVTLDMKSNGVFICITIAHSLYAVVCTLLFRRGKWKLNRV